MHTSVPFIRCGVVRALYLEVVHAIYLGTMYNNNTNIILIKKAAYYYDY